MKMEINVGNFSFDKSTKTGYTINVKVGRVAQEHAVRIYNQK